MKKVDLFNLYMGEPRPSHRWAEREIGSLTVRLADDYDAKVAQLPQPKREISSLKVSPARIVKEEKHLPPREGTWQATATVSYQDSKEKSVLLHEERDRDDGGLWDLCNLLTFLTGRRVVTTEYKRRYRPDAYGDYAVANIEALETASLAWQHRDCLVTKDLHTALLLYNEAMGIKLLQARAALYSTALNIILDSHKTTHQKVSKNIRKKLKNEISNTLNCFEQKGDLQSEQAKRYRPLLNAQIDRGPVSKDKLLSLLQSLEIIGQSPPSDQEDRVQEVDQVRNRLVHTGRPKLKGFDLEQSKIHTIKIVTEVVPEIIRIAIGFHLGFRSGGTGSYCQSDDDLIAFFRNGVFRDQGYQEFEKVAKYVLKKNRELYQRLS